MCKFCKNYDFGAIGFDFIYNDKYPSIYFPDRVGNVPQNERFNYCPVCGEKLTEKNFPSISNKETSSIEKGRV